MRYLLQVLLLGACASPIAAPVVEGPVVDLSGDPATVALRLWHEADYGSATRCEGLVRSVRLEYLSALTLASRCGAADLDGCLRDGTAYLRDGTSYGTAVHEVMHALFACMTGHSDDSHADPIWAPLWVD